MGGRERLALHLHSYRHLAACGDSDVAVTRAALAGALLITVTMAAFVIGAINTLIEDTGEDW